MTRGAGKDTRSNRATWRSSAAAVMVLAATAGPGPAAADAPPAFDPPHSDLLLSRTLVRALPDGKTIATRRSYQVRITRTAGGFQVDGRLVDVMVDAPPSLQGLAELERRRPDKGLFPIRLDARGMIVSTMPVVQDATVHQAGNLLAERISGSGLVAIDMLQAQAFAARLRDGGARSVWPEDVFRPALGKRSEARKLVLPGGNEGQVLIEIVGQGAGPAGQVAALDRVVTTDMDGDRRSTREHWEITRHPSGDER